MRNPRVRIASITPIAMTSLEAKMAVGGFSRSSKAHAPEFRLVEKNHLHRLIGAFREYDGFEGQNDTLETILGATQIHRPGNKTNAPVP